VRPASRTCASWFTLSSKQISAGTPGRATLKTERIARALLERTLPKSEWTHEAHLRAGLWHVLRYPADEALARLRESILAHNVASGGVNSASEGYHETVTRFYVCIIRSFVMSVDRERPVDELALELVERLGDRKLPLRYYTAERLFSAAARLAWVEPDLEALPCGLEDTG